MSFLSILFVWIATTNILIQNSSTDCPLVPVENPNVEEITKCLLWIWTANLVEYCDKSSDCDEAKAAAECKSYKHGRFHGQLLCSWVKCSEVCQKRKDPKACLLRCTGGRDECNPSKKKGAETMLICYGIKADSFVGPCPLVSQRSVYVDYEVCFDEMATVDVIDLCENTPRLKAFCDSERDSTCKSVRFLYQMPTVLVCITLRCEQFCRSRDVSKCRKFCIDSLKKCHRSITSIEVQSCVTKAAENAIESMQKSTPVADYTTTVKLKPVNTRDTPTFEVTDSETVDTLESSTTSVITKKDKKATTSNAQNFKLSWILLMGLSLFSLSF